MNESSPWCHATGKLITSQHTGFCGTFVLLLFLCAFETNSNYQKSALVGFYSFESHRISLYITHTDLVAFRLSRVPGASLLQASCPQFCPLSSCVLISIASLSLTLAMFRISLGIVVHRTTNLPTPLFLHLIHSDISGDWQIICWSPYFKTFVWPRQTKKKKKAMRWVLSGIFPMWNIKITSL